MVGITNVPVHESRIIGSEYAEIIDGFHEGQVLETVGEEAGRESISHESNQIIIEKSCIFRFLIFLIKSLDEPHGHIMPGVLVNLNRIRLGCE